jgi:hypothetical protein
MPNRKLSSAHREELRKFLNSTSVNFQQYHARKESLAWVATTVYLGGLLGLNSLLIENGKIISLGLELKWGFVVVIVITCIVTITFMAKQLADRTVAAHIMASCNEVLSQLLDPSFNLTEQHLHVCDYEKLGHSLLYPKILIDHLKSSTRQPRRILWNYLSPYLAVSIWTIASIAFIITS